MFKKYLLLFSIIFTVIVISFFVFFLFSINYIKDVKLIDSSGETKNIGLPYLNEGGYNEEFSFMFNLYHSRIKQTYIHIIPDDEVLYIRVNDSNISLANINPQNLRDYNNGFHIGIGKYLNEGNNKIEIRIKNSGGGKFGLKIGISYKNIITTVMAFLMLYYILAMIYMFKRQIYYIFEKYPVHLFLIIITIIAIISRFTLIPYVSADIGTFLIPWYDRIKANGFFSAFKTKFSDYPPLYLYLLAIATKIPVNKLISIKFISIIFDFIGAIFAYKLVKLRYKDNLIIPGFAYMIFLFSPTIILNSSAWGQCDIIFTVFSVISIYYLLKKRYIFSMLFYAFSLSLKLQAIFIFPLFILYLLHKDLAFKYFFILPGIYILTIIPAAITGRDFMDLLFIYTAQANQYPFLTLAAPNMYQWLPSSSFLIFNNWGLVFASGVLSMIFFMIWIVIKNRSINNEMVIQISLLFSILSPFILPRMHERYFFMADFIAIIYAFYFPRFFYVPILIILASFLSYCPFLFGITIISEKLIPFIILFVIIVVFYKWIRDYYVTKKINII